MNDRFMPDSNSAALRIYEAVQDLPAVEFDIHDDQQMKESCGERLWKPIQRLLQTHELAVHRKAMRAQTDAEKAREFDILLADLKSLRAGVRDAWEDL